MWNVFRFVTIDNQLWNEKKIPSYCFNHQSKGYLYRDVCYTHSYLTGQKTHLSVSSAFVLLSHFFFSLFDVSIKVSWIRKKDLHILTSENFVFSGDQRFTVLHQPDSNEWNLKIEYATLKDSGVYECQVNTEPKIKLSVLLEVTGEGVKCKREVFFDDVTLSKGMNTL